MQPLLFATTPLLGPQEPRSPANPELPILLLARSLRTFGGAQAAAPLLVLLPSGGRPLSAAAQAELERLGARLLPFDLPPQAARFPFAARVFAAAGAERAAAADAAQLAWLDADTLLLGDLSDLLLAPGKRLACCPVHVSNIGAPWNQPPEEFWQVVYARCGVESQCLFPVLTVVEERPIAAYFNAGLLGVRPAEGLLQAWAENFERLYLDPALDDFYWLNKRYKLFAYQAILAGTLLARLTQEEFQLLPPVFNFPLHLLERIAPARRPARLNDLRTCRYDELGELQRPAWQALLPAAEPLTSWLSANLPA